MRTRTFWRLVLTASAGAAAYALAVRPWHLRWGATEAEQAQAWPGDELIPGPCRQVTHAVTVHAPAATVWAYIVQIGQDRAGYYSYSWLENLFGADIHNIDHIVPEYQQRQVGDTVWMAARDKYRGEARMTVVRLEPGHSMVLVDPQDWKALQRGDSATRGIWAFHVREMDENTSRLIIRGRTGKKPLMSDLLDYIFWEPAHFVMERKMMNTVRWLSEKATGAVRL